MNIGDTKNRDTKLVIENIKNIINSAYFNILMFVSKIPGVTGMRIMTFILCFLQYVFIHCCRSTWSYVAGRMT